MDFKKGDEVWILDFPFGRPLNIKGTIVGKVGREHYNVKIQTGILEGDVIKYKYWKLYSLDNQEEIV
jgi:hypothetical protein|tara:strand:- start:799 stop:999 length:201 start_codon:yes stop_codon:yes gene_type:complete